MKKDITNAQVNILLEIDGIIHLVGMKKDNLDAVGLLIKASADTAYATDKTQKDLREFLGLEENTRKLRCMQP